MGANLMNRQGSLRDFFCYLTLACVLLGIARSTGIQFIITMRTPSLSAISPLAALWLGCLCFLSFAASIASLIALGASLGSLVGKRRAGAIVGLFSLLFFGGLATMIAALY